MEEDRIFRLLNNLSLRPVEPDTAFPRLNPKVVENVAKNIAAVLCNPAKDKIHCQTDCIRLLKNLCGNKADHVSVNETNYKSFLELSPLSKENPTPDVYKFQREIQTEIGDQTRNILGEMIDFYSKRTEQYEAESERLELINSYNQKSFIDFKFIPSKKLENDTEITHFLTGFMNKNAHPTDETREVQQEISQNEKRKSDIKVGYAVINLDAPTKLKVLRNLCNQLKLCSPRRQFETEFLKFAFESVDELQTEMLEIFPSLVEEPLIELCRNLLEDPTLIIAIDQRYEFLEKCLKIKPKIIHMVVQIIYELYAISDYNNFLLELIKFVGCMIPHQTT